MGAAPSLRLRLVDIAKKLEENHGPQADENSIIAACDALYSKAHKNRDKGRHGWNDCLPLPRPPSPHA